LYRRSKSSSVPSVGTGRHTLTRSGEGSQRTPDKRLRPTSSMRPHPLFGALAALEVDRAVDEDRVVVVRAVDAVPAGAANGSSAADSPGPPSGSPVRRPWRHLPARPRFLPGWPSPPGLDLGLGGPARRPG